MNYKNNAKNFVKLHRKILDWKWYADSNTKDLFIHCLLLANWEPGEWNGVRYEAGQFITSLGSLAAETGMSVQNVRTALKHLESTGEVTQKAIYKATQDDTHGPKAICSLITINNWEKYQGKRKKSTQDTTQNLTTVIEIKEEEGLPEGSAPSSEEADEWEWEDAWILSERMRREQEDEGTV